MKYKAVLFDMDGVLIDSEWLIRAASIQSLEEYGIHAQHEDFLEFTGMGEDRFISGVVEKYGKTYDPSMKQRAYDFYGQRVKEDAVVPRGVGEMLETLHSRDIKLAICSAADRRKVLYNLSALGVSEDLFCAIVSGNEVARKKPFPDIYLKGAEMVGEMPADCLVVEDAVSGVQAAHAAGMDAAAVPTTFTKEQLQQRAAPEYLLDEVRELAGLPGLGGI